MLSNEKLYQFALLAVKIGVNLQEGQDLVIRSSVNCRETARVLGEAAYKSGARHVYIEWSDENFTRIVLENESTEGASIVPPWTVAQRDYVVDNNAASIAITSEDPSIYEGIAPEKLKARAIATRTVLKKYYDASMSNRIRWLVLPVPSQGWADKVFNNAPNSVDLLWDAIAKTMRLDEADPVAAWQQHIEKLQKRSQFLNDNRFEYLHFTAKNGTDLKVGLADGHFWTAARELAADGVGFTANMPTEEVFTAPHNLHTEGVVKSALPLIEQGNIIDNFSITFKAGKVVDFSAEKGYETLKNIIETDEGSCRIGEVALIGKNSPIAQSGILFYNTLFDENASCHLALGKAYPTTIIGGEKMSREQLNAVGCNESLEHCDFMIGTPDMNIVGVKASGEKVQIFKDGEWVI